jgi:hypothetical protein
LNDDVSAHSPFRPRLELVQVLAARREESEGVGGQPRNSGLFNLHLGARLLECRLSRCEVEMPHGEAAFKAHRNSTTAGMTVRGLHAAGIHLEGGHDERPTGRHRRELEPRVGALDGFPRAEGRMRHADGPERQKLYESLRVGCAGLLDEGE